MIHEVVIVFCAVSIICKSLVGFKVYRRVGVFIPLRVVDRIVACMQKFYIKTRYSVNSRNQLCDLVTECIVVNADDISTDKEYVPQGGKTVTVISNGGTVNIRRGNGTQYEKIAAIKPGTSLPYVATAENSWHAVVIGNEVGWISGDYSKIE